MDFKTTLKNRFFRYVQITTQSDPDATVTPSTPGQWDFAKMLMEEMKEYGVVDMDLSDKCVLIGRLPSNLPADHAKVPTVGWVTHMDTVDMKLSPDVHPIMIENYQGGDICQNEEKQIYIRAAERPELQDYIGQDIIVSDGTSVLGADDKAAVTNIMTTLEYLHENPEIPHGEIYVCFVPDEEIGLVGAKAIEFDKFPVDFAYTIDCCELGEVVWQTFNAGSATVKVTGATAHPMSSKNNLVNPALAAVDFINLLDRAETPEHTEKTEGFIWVTHIQADYMTATVHMNIRDHDKEKYMAKKEYIKAAVEMCKLKNPKAQYELSMTDVYSNIKDAITPENKQCIDLIYKAFDELSIEPKTIAMRGGTDGSFISTKGIPTPNYFTGALNFHASYEFLPMDSFEASLKVTLKLIDLITKG